MTVHESLDQERRFSLVTLLVFVALLAGTTTVIEAANHFSSHPSYASDPQAMLAAGSVASAPNGVCKKQYTACMKTVKNKKKCTDRWKGCIKKKCPTPGGATGVKGGAKQCKKDKECVAACTEATKPDGTLTSCCSVAEPNNSCKTKVGEGAKACNPEITKLPGSNIDPKVVEKMLGEVKNKINDLQTKADGSLDGLNPPLTEPEKKEFEALKTEKTDYEAQIRKYGEDAASAAPDNMALRNETGVLQKALLVEEQAGLLAPPPAPSGDAQPAQGNPAQGNPAQTQTFGEPPSAEPSPEPPPLTPAQIKEIEDQYKELMYPTPTPVEPEKLTVGSLLKSLWSPPPEPAFVPPAPSEDSQPAQRNPAQTQTFGEPPSAEPLPLTEMTEAEIKKMERDYSELMHPTPTRVEPPKLTARSLFDQLMTQQKPAFVPEKFFGVPVPVVPVESAYLPPITVPLEEMQGGSPAEQWLRSNAPSEDGLLHSVMTGTADAIQGANETVANWLYGQRTTQGLQPPAYTPNSNTPQPPAPTPTTPTQTTAPTQRIPIVSDVVNAWNTIRSWSWFR